MTALRNPEIHGVPVALAVEGMVAAIRAATENRDQLPSATRDSGTDFGTGPDSGFDTDFDTARDSQ
jgi:adenosylcobinamide amidohydrolase